MDRRRKRLRLLALATTGLLVALTAPAITPAAAAPTRYEAENATITAGVTESNHAGFSGSGFVNYDNAVGSAVEWTVDAASAGQATIAFRYANGTTANRPLSVAVNGAVVNANLAFPGTGAWTTWQTVTITAPLNAGTNTIKATATTANGGPNLDALDVDIAAAATDLQAEDATITAGVVESNHAGFTGRGFVNYDNAVGSAVEFTVNAPTAGSASLAFRYANGTTANRPLSISVNGAVVNANLAFPGTGAWTTWQTVTITAPLNAGANKVKATATTANGGPNLDKLTAGVGGGNDTEAPTAPTNARSTGATCESIALAWNASTDNVGVTEYQVVSNGNIVGRTPNTTFSVLELTPNTSYTFAVTATDAAGNRSPASNAVTATTGASCDDPQPPTPPGNLRSTGATTTSISLAWNASTDNVGVVGYELNRGGTWTQIGNITTYTDTGLTPDTSYTYSVRAYDAAGLRSQPSNQITARTNPSSGGNTPVAINGQLHVCGLKLCNQYNRPIQLRGMSTHGLQWYPQCVNNASLDALANDWNADVIRLSMYIQEGGYETNPRKFTDLMHALIEAATARGIYVIVDWHQLSPGDPNYNLARAKTFFTEIAQRHKDKPNILYDVANEPNGVSWNTVRNYHQQIIPVVRAQDADSVILLGTHAWGSLGVSDGRNETDVINNQVTFGNVMYTFHFYAASHGTEYLNTLSRAADRIPMFVTEFGTQTASGDGGNNFTRSQQYIDLMASKKISWVNWNFSDDNRSGAVFTSGTCPGGPFAGTSRLKPAGVWVRDRIRTPDDFPTG